MGDVVNLRQARKRALRRAKDAEAGENRVRFGIPKPLAEAARHEAQRSAAHLDAHRLSGDDGRSLDPSLPASPMSAEPPEAGVSTGEEPAPGAHAPGRTPP